MDNIEIVSLELINSNKDAIRRAREAFLISKSKIFQPVLVVKKFNTFFMYPL